MPSQIHLYTKSPLTLAVLGCFLAVAALSTPARADSESGKPATVNMPHQALADALARFSVDTGIHIVVAARDLIGKSAPDVKGELTPRQTLDALLAGSGLRFDFQPDGSARIERTSLTHLQEVQVVGDRDHDFFNADTIRTEDDVQPYTIFSSEEIQTSGATTIEEFLNTHLTRSTQQGTLIQHQNINYGVFTPNNAINLNGVGVNESLILVDGRRWANVSYNGYSGGAGTSQADINGIPMAMVERIEVLPSSSAALYGASSVGGVINIILKRQFTGGEVNVDFKNTFNGSDPKRSISLVLGNTFNEAKTQVMLSLNSSSGGSLTMGDRIQWWNRANALTNQYAPWTNGVNNWPTQGALTNIVSASFDPTTGAQQNLTLKNGTPLNSPITFVPAGISPTTSTSTLYGGLLANAGQANFGPAPTTSYQGTGNELDPTPKKQAQFLTLQHKIDEQFSLFAQVNHTSERLQASYDPVSYTYTVAASNPFNPFNQDVQVGMPYGTSTSPTSESDTTSFTLGLGAHLSNGWNANIDYTHSQNKSSYYVTQDIVNPVSGVSAIQTAINAGLFNPFIDSLKYPPSLDQYFGSLSEAVETHTDSLNLRDTGPIGNLPWGKPQLTTRLEFRREGYGNDNIQQYSPAVPAAGVSANTSTVTYFAQSQSVVSGGAELEIPLISSQNARMGVRELTMQVAGSFDRYKTNAVTPSNDPYSANPATPGTSQDVSYTARNSTLGFRYAPVQEVTIRASYSTSFQPPTALQLVPSHILAGGNLISDPQYPNLPPYNIQTYGYGNPNLKPQQGKTNNIGLIWAPESGFAEGLRLDVEHYVIDQPGIITQLGVQQIINSPNLASRVTRDPSSGLITSVDTSLINAFDNKVGGWDFKLDYRLPALGIGNLALGLRYSRISYDSRQIAAGSAPIDYAGYPEDGGEAKGKANAWLQWEKGPWMAKWTTSYTSSFETTFAANSPTTLTGGWAGYTAGGPILYSTAMTLIQGGTTIPAQFYHDILVRYDINRHVRAMFGISNVFNAQPPFENNGWYPLEIAFGDGFLGRTYRMNLRYSF